MINFFKVVPLLVAISAIFPANISFSYDGPADSSRKSSSKAVFLTTGDLKEEYEILGIVTATTGSTNIEALGGMLIDKAKLLGADYVISIRYFGHVGALYCYGTAVKKKNKADTSK